MTIIRTTRSSKRASQSHATHQPPPSSKPTPDPIPNRKSSPTSNLPAKKPRTTSPQPSMTDSQSLTTEQPAIPTSSASTSSGDAATRPGQTLTPPHSFAPPSTSSPTSLPSPTHTLNVNVPLAHGARGVSASPTSPSTAITIPAPTPDGISPIPTSSASSVSHRPSGTAFTTSTPVTTSLAPCSLALPAACATSTFKSESSPTVVHTASCATVPSAVQPVDLLPPGQSPSGSASSPASQTDAVLHHQQTSSNIAPVNQPTDVNNTSDDFVRKPQTTAHIICPSSEIEQASIVRLDAWVPIDVVARIYKLCDYTDLSSTSYSIANIPSSATWGSKHACMDRSTYLCIDNEPIVAWVTGAVVKKWFTDYQGHPQSPVKLAVIPARSIDLVSARYWLDRGTGSKVATTDAVWASKLMLEWSADPDIEKPEVTPFTNIFDATNRFSCQDELAQKMPHFFRVGDIILMEFHITRYKPKGSKTTTWNSFQVGFELVAIDVIARNPSITLGTDVPTHSPIKRRVVNI